MNKFISKLAKIFLGLSMAAGGAVAISVGRKDASHAQAEDTTATINQSAAGLFYESSSTSTTVHSFTVNSQGFAITGAKTKSSASATSGYGYIMLMGGQIYNTSAPSNQYIASVTVTYTSGTGTSGSVVGTFGAAAITTRNTTGTGYTPTKGGSKVFTNTTQTYAYFNISNKTTSNTQVSSVVVVWKDKTVTKTLDSISINTDNVRKVFTTGDTFNSTGLVTTAHYTVPASFPDATVTPTSISSPDMSSAGEKTITVSYTEGGVTKTATYKITVNDPRSVTGLTVYDEELNELSDEDEITLTASSGSSISTDVMCEVTYSPSGSDGSVSITSASGTGFSINTEDDETYTLTFTANGNHVITFEASEDDSFAITVTYIVSGLPNVTTVTDTIDNALTGVGTGTTYTTWSGKTDQSDAVYAGKSAGGNTTVQLRTSGSDEGVVTTQSSGGVATVITLTFNNNTADSRRVDVYGKNTAYSAASDLFNASNQGTLIGYATYDKNGTGETVYTIDVSSDETKQFSYIGIRSNGSALYLDSIEITWSIEQEIVDVLENIFIDGSLTTSTYVEGQTISLEGLTVYGHYTTAGDVSLMGKTGLTFGCTPTTATSTSLNEITVNASYEGKNASETYEITVSADSVTALSWGTRGYENGDYFLSGKTLSECIDTSKWTFDPTWASGLDKGTPTFGTGSDNVHVGLYASPAPSAETAIALTNSYTFSTADDGKYLVAFYKGAHSTNNRQLFITELLNSIVKPAEGDAGYFLVKDASNLSAGDTVVIAAFNYDYAMSSTQGSNNRAGVEITKNESDSSMTIASGVQEFTLEAGTESGTWSFSTGEGYIYAASSGSNHLKTETDQSGNSSFTLTIANTGSASLVANGSNTRKTMSWNNSNTLFSCYSSLQSNGQLAIYKYTEPMDEPINNLDLKVQHVVVEYAKSFSDTLGEICIAYGSTDSDDLSQAWSDLDIQFTNWFTGSTKSLNAEEKTFAKSMFANAKYTVRDSEDNDSLQAMLGKYDEILSHYNLNDFLKDDSGRAAAPQKSNVVFSELFAQNTSSVAIIVIISMVSVTAIGRYFFLKKRKENN